MPYFAGVAAILTVIKPTLAYSKRIEKFTTLWAGYLEISLALCRIIEEMQIIHDVTPEVIKGFNLIRNRFDDLSKRDDPYPNLRLMKKQQKLVEKEVPTNCFWTPPDE